MPSNSSPDQLPSGLSSIWRMWNLAYRSEPWLLVWAFALTLLAALPDSLMALWLKFLAQGIVDHQNTLLYVAVLGLALSAAATWMLSTFSTRIQRRFRDKITITLEAHVARLQASVSTVAHHERPEYLDRLAVLRDQVFVLDHMFMSLFGTCGWILRLGITIALLMSINPILALLVLFALPTVFTSAWRPAVERVAQERGAQAQRLAKHLFTLASTAPPGKEVRVLGIQDMLSGRRRRAWEIWYEHMSKARLGTAIWNSLAWAIFGAAYVASIIFVASGHHASPGNVLLVLAAGSRLSTYIAGTVGEIGFLRGIWLDGSRRLMWLEDYAAALISNADQAPPSRLERGIRFENVSFAYPGTERLVLEGVDLTLPSGSVVAIVGENGAGKTTLIKLLAKLYEPTSGRILVDDQVLSRISTEQWRHAMAGAFQDFYRFELLTRETVGVGDVPRIEHREAIAAAVDRAGADDAVEKLPRGLDTQLGPSWPEGVDVSFGQWQKLALARGFMRDDPIVLILDEPTAALDAETEHALFERYASAAMHSNSRQGCITILVSHRFSTVRMADLIVVMDGARAVETGSHEQLMAHQGRYAELYGIQAAAYQ